MLRSLSKWLYLRSIGSVAIVEIKDRPIGTNHCPIHRYNGSAVLLARTLRYSHVHHGRHLGLMRPKNAPPQHLSPP